jgi:hemolysin activation/secretion protein
VIEQRTRIHGTGPVANLNLDKLSVAYARVQAEVRYPEVFFGGALQGRAALELRKGTDLFDATPAPTGVSAASPDGFTPSRFEGNSQALVARFDADASIGLGQWITLAGMVRGQWADNPLLSYEEFSVGNLNIGRGYDPGANSGDSAIGLRGELRARWPSNTALNGEAFTFYDSVTVWNQDSGTTENGRTLESWGGGLRVFLPGRLVFDLMYAQPLDKALSIDSKVPGGRVMFSLTTQFLPRPN